MNYKFDLIFENETSPVKFAYSATDACDEKYVVRESVSWREGWCVEAVGFHGFGFENGSGFEFVFE